jgi:Uma2 family endonuclease
MLSNAPRESETEVMTALPKEKYTLEEYLELDRKSEERLEFWNGEIFSMSGVSEQHDRIESNLMFKLRLQHEDRDCRLFTANMRIKVPTAPPYRYGDLSGLCGSPAFEKIGGVDVLINPTLIIEVLSDSTEAYDRGDKFTHYKSIPTLTEYLLIAQHRPHVTQFSKQLDGWKNLEFNEMGDTVQVVSLGCEITLGEIYKNVNLTSPTPAGLV